MKKYEILLDGTPTELYVKGANYEDAHEAAIKQTNAQTVSGTITLRETNLPDTKANPYKALTVRRIKI